MSSFKENFNLDYSSNLFNLEDLYGAIPNRVIHSYINNASTKYISVQKLNSAGLVFVLNPVDGNLIEAKRFEIPGNYSSYAIYAGGRVSDNTVFYSLLSFGSSNFHTIIFLNIDTWETNAYTSESYTLLYGFSQLYNTDQIILLYAYNLDKFFSLEATYDKLHLTEFLTK